VRLFVAESPFAKQRGDEAAWTELFGARSPSVSYQASRLNRRPRRPMPPPAEAE
jgi:hypothetical protein